MFNVIKKNDLATSGGSLFSGFIRSQIVLTLLSGGRLILSELYGNLFTVKLQS